MGITLLRPIAPYNILHVGRQLLKHLRILPHNVAPHQHTHFTVDAMSFAVALLYDVIHPVDMLAIYLIGTMLTHIVPCTSAAQRLSLIAVDIKKTTAVIGSHCILYLLAQKRVCLLLAGIDIRGAVHNILIVGYTQCLFEMGKTLQVGHHVRVIGIFIVTDATVARNVRILFVVQGVFGIIVSEIHFVSFCKTSRLLTEQLARYRPAADVVKPSTILVGRPVGNGHAGHIVLVYLFQLVKGLHGIAPTLVAHTPNSHSVGCYLNLVCLCLIAGTLYRFHKVAPWGTLAQSHCPLPHHHLLGSGYHTNIGTTRLGRNTA